MVNLEILRLNNNQIAGGLPAEIGNMAALGKHRVLFVICTFASWHSFLCLLIKFVLSKASLNIRDNAISGGLPTTIGNLVNLGKSTAF